MYLGNHNFPEAGDIKKEHIDKMEPEALPDLIQHLQMQLERCFGQHGTREKMHSLHITSLIRITRGRIADIEKEGKNE